MTRLFLAFLLVSQLSGVAGMTAVLCETQVARSHPCCCSTEGNSNGASLPAHVPLAGTKCPCTVAPALPSPVNQAPATTVASRAPVAAPAVVPAAPLHLTLDFDRHASPRPVRDDAAPPLLSASHLRC